MNAQRSYTASKENTDMTKPVVIDEMTQCEACKEHNEKRKYFCTCGSLETEKEETLKETTKLLMFRLSSLQWRKGRTRGHAGSLAPESQYYQTESNTSEKHRKNKSQVVQIDETKSKISVSACRKTAARTKQWKVGIESHVDRRKSTK